MAILRGNPQPVFKGRSLDDFESYRIEREKLDEFTKQRDDLNRRIVSAENERSDAIRKGKMPNAISERANAMVEGIEAKTEIDSLVELRNQKAVVEEAIRLQSKKLEDSRQIAAREIAGDFLADDKRLCHEVESAAKQLVESQKRLETHRANFLRAAGESMYVVSPLQQVALNPRGPRLIENDLLAFSDAMKQYK